MSEFMGLLTGEQWPVEAVDEKGFHHFVM